MLSPCHQPSKKSSSKKLRLTDSEKKQPRKRYYVNVQILTFTTVQPRITKNLSVSASDRDKNSRLSVNKQDSRSTMTLSPTSPRSRREVFGPPDLLEGTFHLRKSGLSSPSEFEEFRTSAPDLLVTAYE
jgi:hypothetical protein